MTQSETDESFYQRDEAKGAGMKAAAWNQTKMCKISHRAEQVGFTSSSGAFMVQQQTWENQDFRPV